MNKYKEKKPKEMILDVYGHREDGKPILKGDVFTTSTGRHTTPYPKVGVRGKVKANNWLIENYRLEAEARHDKFNVTLSKAMNPKNFTQSDIMGIHLYLWG